MNTLYRSRLAITTLLLTSAAMPGCVVWDINDGILASNDNLGRIEDELQAIDAQLVDVNSNISAVNTSIAQVDGQMQTMGTTLTSMDAQLQSLQSQLDATNKHLASLRKTINNIDNTIPFLKLSGDDEDEQEELENGEVPTNGTDTNGASQPPKPNPAETTDPNAGPKGGS